MKTKIKTFRHERPRNPNTKPVISVDAFLTRMFSFFIVFMLLIYLIIFSAILSSCTGPGTMIDSGYLVSITKNHRSHIYKVSSLTEAENTLWESANIKLNTNDLIGEKDPFFEFRNSEVFIYIEKKGIYEKKGKKRWKIYDEKLANTK